VNVLDTQQIEALGRSRLKSALIEAGLEVATPERDKGVDLIAYRWEPDSGEFVAVPIQMKAARDFIFGVDRKYERIPHLVIAYAMHVRADDHAIYALTYKEAESVARKLGWTNTRSWADGYYVQTRPSAALRAALEPYLVTPDAWSRFFPRPRRRAKVIGLDTRQARRARG
jgi:hypothetical protein